MQPNVYGRYSTYGKAEYARKLVDKKDEWRIVFSPDPLFAGDKKCQSYPWALLTDVPWRA